MAVMLTTTAIAQPTTNRPQPATGLELVAAETELDAKRPEGEPTILDLNTYMAARKGAFEVHVLRDGDTYRAQRVIRDERGEIRQTIDLPDGLTIDPYAGFVDFFVITAKTGLGEIVATTSGAFCPISWGKARVADTGPDTTIYPNLCDTSPVAHAVVWGIESGWATPAPDAYTVALDLPDGTYTLTVEVAASYRSLFGIPANKARVSVQVTVEAGSEPSPETPELIDPHDPDRDHTTSAVEEPRVSSEAHGLPDLIALPAHQAMTVHDEVEGRDYLAFGATVWNGGDGPLVVEGFRSTGSATMTAFQYFYEDGEKTGRARVGTFEYDAQDGHDHWHFTDFAQYRLLDASGSEAVRSGKEAFCLAPTDGIDLTLAAANWQPFSRGLATSCGVFGAIWIRQILDVGWGDTYHQWLPGQSFDITELPNGDYLIEITTNSDGRLRELRDDNNTALLAVRLGGEPGNRTVEVAEQ